MKLRIPGRKKNRKDDFRADDTVFDFTGAKNDSKKTLAATAGFGIPGAEEDSFEVRVRNAEPLIRRLENEHSEMSLLHHMQLNIASAALMTAMICLLLVAAEMPELSFYAAPGFLVYMFVATMDALEGEKAAKVRLIIAAIGVIALVASLIVFRKYIINGWALIMNYLYDVAEMAQAYIYNRFHVGATGDEDPYRCMHAATIWTSCILGVIAALPPAPVRRVIAIVFAGLTMIALAYYGVIPAWVCIAVIAAALVFVLARGTFLSSLAVFLMVAIVFGAVTFIDPGENYAISRADENFRDRFALISSYLDKGDSSVDDLNELEEQMQDQQNREREESGSEFMAEHKALITLLIIALVIALMVVTALLLLKRLRARQAANRRGIDSSDPKEAVTAMFPYLVRWLQPAGIDVEDKPFAWLIPSIRADISSEYADNFADMYDLWQEAAYSDHEISENSRVVMRDFLDETIDMVRDQSDLSSRLINTVKYAL